MLRNFEETYTEINIALQVLLFKNDLCPKLSELKREEKGTHGDIKVDYFIKGILELR